ncbi:MAG TPA: glycosyltransferase family 39 protein [bacterium]|nr:glycosyltransferase family 39 protein [bacterium]
MPTKDLLKSHALWPHWVALLAFISIISAARLHTFDEPIERDLAVYAVTAHGLLHGRVLYSDLWDHKPPAIHLTYALAELVTGYGQQEFFFLGLLGTILTLVGLYRLGSSTLGPQAGFWAAALWTCICSDMSFEANQPNVETFINAALVWTLVYIVPDGRTSRHLALAGSFLALAGFYKPQAFLYIILFPAVIWTVERGGKRLSQALRSFLWLLIPSLVLWAVCFLYFFAVGRFQDFYDAVFVFNKFYSTQRPTLVNLAMGFWPQNLFPDFSRFLGPTVVLIVLAALGSLRRLGNLWLFFLAYLAGTFLFVASSGQFLPHYYQLWLPLLALGGGMAIVVVGGWLKGLTPLPALACLWLIVPHEVGFYSLSSHQWSDRKYHDHFLLAYDLAHSLKGILKPGETFLHFGNETPLYFYAEADPPTGLTYIYPFKIGPLAERLNSRFLADQAAHKPQLVVLDNIVYAEYRPTYFKDYDLWRYYPIDKRYALLVRRGGELEARLRREGRFFDRETVNRAD